MENTFVIGDIHGCADLLKTLVMTVDPQKDDKFVFLGDCIDRGPDSFEVIEYLIGLEKEFHCVFLKGNHEDMFLDYLSGINEKIFLLNGGEKTLDSYRDNDYSLRADHPDGRILPLNHRRFFQEMKYLYETDDYIFVHAGIDVDFIGARYVAAKDQNRETVIWDRKFHDQARHLYSGPRTVIYGHTPHGKVRFNDFAICIDTGAVFGGKLTCLKLPERSIISV